MARIYGRGVSTHKLCRNARELITKFEDHYYSKRYSEANEVLIELNEVTKTLRKRNK